MDYITKIADVEFASIGVTPEHLTKAETPNWIAPEVLSGEGRVSPRSDVYSLALVLYEIYSRRIPFGNILDSNAVVKCVINGERPPLDEVQLKLGDGKYGGLNERFKSVIRTCWTHEAPSRPDISSVVAELKAILELGFEAFPNAADPESKNFPITLSSSDILTSRFDRGSSL